MIDKNKRARNDDESEIDVPSRMLMEEYQKMKFRMFEWVKMK